MEWHQFLAATGHIVYPLLPVIYEVVHSGGIRPERPMAVATIASPVSAATAAWALHHEWLYRRGWRRSW